MKIVLMILAVLVVLMTGYVVYATTAGNARVVETLKADPQGKRAGIVMMLTFADGKMIPVNYLKEDGFVYVGADGPWWRSFRGEGQPVSMWIRGETLTGQATVILDDDARVKDVFSRLRPTVPKWLPDWANGKLVAIKLDAATN